MKEKDFYLLENENVELGKENNKLLILVRALAGELKVFSPENPLILEAEEI